MSATGDPAQAGTTLIEALAALAITTLVALIAFPRVQQALVSLAQKQTVAVVAARLRQVRADALTGDRATAFAVAADGRGYGASNSPFARTLPGVELHAPQGRAIAFYGDGSSSGGAVWVSAGRSSVAVSVAPATGTVSVGR
jgi:type II secretory pathway pseudopilin PulG